jgi:hypothetical protein
MQIISKFKDYYDSVQGVMYDSNIIYLRKNRTIKVKLGYTPSDQSCLYVIGICGEYYPLSIMKESLRVSNKIKKWKNKNLLKMVFNKEIRYYSYDIDIAEEYDRIMEGVTRVRWRWRQQHHNIKQYYDDLKILLIKEDYFDKYDTPIFILKPSDSTHRILEIGCNLNMYNFQKVKDPYTIFQDIVMWKNNRVVAEDPDQIVDSVVLRDSKGFDKWSFKKRSSRDK